MTRIRLLAGATAMAIVMVVAVPAAVAAYTGNYTPTQSISTHTPFLTPTFFACTAPGNTSVSLTWTDADATTADPYGAFVISGYEVDRKVNGGSWSVLASPGRTTPAASDGNFGLLTLGDTISYRVHSTKSNWVSADTTNTVTATVSSLLIFTHVTCP